MKFRGAVIEDLPFLKAMYRAIVHRMRAKNIFVWNEIYPCVCLEEDIKNNRVYLLEDREEIISALSLYKKGNSVGIERLGVNVKYLRRGMASFILKKAERLAEEWGAERLKLFVADGNIPALRLYAKNGFIRTAFCDEVIDEEFILHEYVYEKKIKGENRVF